MLAGPQPPSIPSPCPHVPAPSLCPLSGDGGGRHCRAGAASTKEKQSSKQIKKCIKQPPGLPGGG